MRNKPAKKHSQPTIVMSIGQAGVHTLCKRIMMSPPVSRKSPLRYTRVGWVFSQILKFRYSEVERAIKIGPRMLAIRMEWCIG